jgi:hypothetical protein
VRIGIAAMADGLLRNSSGSRTAMSKRRVPSISVETASPPMPACTMARMSSAFRP